MEIELSRLFVKVVQNGSFSRAAEKLKIPKSTISKAISRLEKETGTVLLLRTTRSLSLTPAGRVFYETCVGPLQVLEEAQKSLYGQSSLLSGTIRMTAPEDLGTEVIAPVVAELTRRHPQLNFELHYTDDVLDLVRDGFDLAIRIGRLKESRLKVKTVGQIQFVLVAAPNYLKSCEKIRHPKDLEKHCGLSMTAWQGQWPLKSQRESCTARVNARITSNQMTSLLQMTMAGAGVALLPEFLCHRALVAGKIVRVLPEWRGTGLAVSLLSPLGTSSSARLKIVSERIVSELQRALTSE